MHTKKILKIGIITLSDRCSKIKASDTSGPAIKKIVESSGLGVVTNYEIIPDDKNILVKRLTKWSDIDKLNIIFTTGGTGLGPRDNTPEATKKVIDRKVPGLSEIMRIVGFKKTPFSILSRGVSGVRKKTLIINLPGSEKAIRECLKIILPVLKHSVDIISGKGH